MAPSRRKGANRAASAAARRKWKVGDPVLAKVKGYPAWPAIVDEPVKWGYPADSKKILVYFFGTQQIAFCNPADVEDFTEEKKVYLLGKRYGKNSDFGRAVKEIVDCFEKLKKQDQVTSANSTVETDIINENNPDESLIKSEKDEAPVNTLGKLSIGAANDLNSLTEAASVAAAGNALHDEEMQLEELHSDFLFAETRMSTTYSTRSKTDVTRSRTQKRTSSRRLRISSRIGASRLQWSSRRLGTNALSDRSMRRSKRITKSSDDSEGNDVDSPACVSNDSLGENNSEVMSVDSDTSLNDGSTVDSGCKPVGEEPFSDNDDGETELSDRLDFQSNTVISKKKRKPNRKRHRSDTVAVDNLDIVVSEAEILKSDCASPSNNENFTEKYAKEEGDEHLPLVKRARVRMGRPSPEGEEEGTVVKEEENTSIYHEVHAIQSSGPLKSEEEGALLNKEEKTLVFHESHAIQSSPPSKCEVHYPVDEESASVKADLSKSSLSHVNLRKSPSWETRKNLVDGEADLPPSKRLHRALEAMSANVAEDSQRASSCSPTVNINNSGCCSTSFVECSEPPDENRASIELGPREVETYSNCDSVSGEKLENDKKTSVVATDKDYCGVDRSNLELCKDAFEHVETVGNDCMKLSPLNEAHAETDDNECMKLPLLDGPHAKTDDNECVKLSPFNGPHAESDDNECMKLSPFNGPHAESDDNKCMKLSPLNEPHVEIDDHECMKMSLLNETHAETDAHHQHVKSDEQNVGEELTNLDCVIESSDLNRASLGSDPDISHTNLDSISVKKITCGSLNIDVGIPIDSVDGEADETPPKEHISSSKNNQNSKRSELVEKARAPSSDSNFAASATPVNVLTSSNNQYLFHSNSTSDHLEDKIVSIAQSSSSLTDGPDSSARASPSSSSIWNISESHNNKYLESNSSCSPDFELHHEKSKVASSSSIKQGNNSSCSPDFQLHLEKAKLASNSISKRESLSYFEGIIRSLTRTKESIGRATRIAIDCAKSGFATKVLEILACKLENESSLHKKVDLFFLVDSITQCSRGMKGDGGIYPSAIQAMLPRLLLAAAPPSCSSHENHRQCLKVLRVWQERKILPEPIIRHHIRELDALCVSYPNIGSRRAFRNERAFDDPIREMEGMLVDEYGSNSSIQLPGFSMPPMLTDDGGGSDSDGDSFEAVTPEHNVENAGETTYVTTVEKRSHILEDVDVELEMEDVAPCCEVEIISTSNTAGEDGAQILHRQFENHYGAPIAPQQPEDAPPASAPLPPPPPPPLTSAPLPPPPPPPLTSAPLPPPPPPPPPLSSAPLPPPPPPPSSYPPILDSISNGPDMEQYPNTQNYYSSATESRAKHSFPPRVKPRSLDSSRHHRDFEAQMPGQRPDTWSFSDPPTSHLSSRAPNSDQPMDSAFSKGFHLRPPHPAPSNQFSYVQERNQSRRDIPPPSHPSRFHSRSADNGNFYRDRDRHKFAPRDNIGEYWRPPLPSTSGSCHRDGTRMVHAPYGGPPREPAMQNNRWNYPPPPMNHRQFHPYGPPSEDPISVTNKGPNYWKSR